MSESKSAGIVHFFIGTSYLFTFFGGLASDAILGRYRTILYMSLVYFLGTLLTTYSALSNSQFALAAGLFLIALGTGGIKPCVSTFGGDQFQNGDERYVKMFFDVFYFTINAGSLISIFISPIVAELKCFGGDSCYPIAFGVPAILLAISVVLFWMGRNSYVTKRPDSALYKAIFARLCVLSSKKLKILRYNLLSSSQNLKNNAVSSKAVEDFHIHHKSTWNTFPDVSAQIYPQNQCVLTTNSPLIASEATLRGLESHETPGDPTLALSCGKHKGETARKRGLRETRHKLSRNLEAQNQNTPNYSTPIAHATKVGFGTDCDPVAGPNKTHFLISQNSSNVTCPYSIDDLCVPLAKSVRIYTNTPNYHIANEINPQESRSQKLRYIVGRNNSPGDIFNSSGSTSLLRSPELNSDSENFEAKTHLLDCSDCDFFSQNPIGYRYDSNQEASADMNTIKSKKFRGTAFHINNPHLSCSQPLTNLETFTCGDRDSESRIGINDLNLTIFEQQKKDVIDIQALNENSDSKPSLLYGAHTTIAEKMINTLVPHISCKKSDVWLKEHIHRINSETPESSHAVRSRKEDNSRGFYKDLGFSSSQITKGGDPSEGVSIRYFDRPDSGKDTFDISDTPWSEFENLCPKTEASPLSESGISSSSMHEHLISTNVPSECDFSDETIDSEIKKAIGVLKTFIYIPFFWMLYDQQSTTWIEQGTKMRETLNLFGFEMIMRPEQMQALNGILILLFIPLFSKFLYPYLQSKGFNMTSLNKMCCGMVLASLSFLAAAVLEISMEKGMSILWQTPQYVLLTAGEIMLSLTGIEFVYNEAPERLKGLLLSGWLITVAAGNLYVVIFTSLNVLQWLSFGDTEIGNYLLYAGIGFTAAYYLHGQSAGKNRKVI